MAFAIDDLSSVIAHWSADAITGLTEGDPATSLPDSISAWNLSLTGATYRASSINSKPCVEFNPSTGYGVTASTKDWSGYKQLHTVIVCSFAANRNFNAVSALRSSAAAPVHDNAAYCAFGSSSGSFTTRMRASFVNYFYTASSVISAATPVMLTDRNGWRGQSISVNGQPTPTTSLVTTTPRSIEIGTSYAHLGWISISGVVYYGNLTVAELVMLGDSRDIMWVEGVLAHKYGISLPASHPFAASAPTTGPSSGGSTVIVIED